MNKSNLNNLLKKLNCKNQKEIFVFNAPREFLSVLWDIGKEIKVKRTVKDEKVDFSLVFVRTKKEIEKYATLLDKHSTDDSIVWFAYPKKTSKTYSSDITQDIGWDNLSTFGYKIISSIAIDNDWTALRFKKRQ